MRHKDQLSVIMRLTGGEPVEAMVFVALGERLMDLLNDERGFIPAKIKDSGEIIVVAKSQIISIIETKADDGDGKAHSSERAHSDADAAASKVIDPYAVLRVASDATTDDIRAAYKQRIKAVHPDTIASLGLDEDLSRAAVRTTQKLNYAYRKIMREREGQSEAASA